MRAHSPMTAALPAIHAVIDQLVSGTQLAKEKGKLCLLDQLVSLQNLHAASTVFS